MAAKDLEKVTHKTRLHKAAIERERVRIDGVVVEVGDGYSGTYANRWLKLSTAGVTVRITSTLNSQLGMAEVGTTWHLAVTFTGMVDVSDGLYFAQRAQVLR